MSKVTMSLNPATGVSYPGATTVTVTVAPTKSTKRAHRSGHSDADQPERQSAPDHRLPRRKPHRRGNHLQSYRHPRRDLHSPGGLSRRLELQRRLSLDDADRRAGRAHSCTHRTKQRHADRGRLLRTPRSNTTLTASVATSKGTPTGNITFNNGTAVADSKQNPVT